MRNKPGILLLAVVMLCLTAGLAVAKQHAWPIKSYGDRSYVDSLAFRNGDGADSTGSIIDTLIGSSRDTSEMFSLMNLKSLSAMHMATFSYGASSGIQVMTCSLEVSQNGANWYRPAGEAVFSRATSADGVNKMIVLFEDTQIDTPVTHGEVSGRSAMSAVGSAMWGRFVTVRTTHATTDTAFSKVVTHRQYLRP